LEAVSLRECVGFWKVGPLDAYKRSVTMLSNPTATVGLFTALADEFDLMYTNRDFLDLYIDEGIDESKFDEAREGLASLIRDYKEIGTA
jgi:tubulin alpha